MESEKAVLSRLIRKVLEMEPNFYGNMTVEIDWRDGKVVGFDQAKGVKSGNMGNLK